ncbi:MAG: potassium-transporting ATPase subunit KdpA [Candidatus Altiarchaeota archaeon]|nr:potassium-transporting ATPase subunit KdpA [Candidatus Altiarchaeota archaeon]
MANVAADTAVFGLCMLAVLLIAKPLGLYIARVFEGRCKFLRILEESAYEACGINPSEEMDWKDYAVSMMLFNIIGIAALLAILLFQQYLPLNPQNYGGFRWDLAVNTAVSFVTNTNWQAYSGESQASYFTQMAGLAVQNFLSAATGLCIAIALIRGITRQSSRTLGNFWADMARGTVYLLLPAAFAGALLLASQGVIQNFSPYVNSNLMEPYVASDGRNVTTQEIPMGPVASQEAIKELGNNGGGFFGANAAHPFENPTPLTNILEILMILAIPFSLTYTFGRMAKDTRQGWAIFAVMMLFLAAAYAFGYYFELKGNPLLENAGISGDYLEGKETRFGIGGSVLYAAATTGTSTGSVNSMHDSMTPLGGMMPMALIMLGEVCPGGIGSGLYTMLPYVIIAVFVAGLMVGRTPEYLGKKIEAIDMRCSVIIVLIPPMLVLLFSAIAILLPEGASSIYNMGPHGVSEILYAFASMANNNGSAFGGLNANTVFYNLMGAIAMLAGRFIPAIAALALAGSLAAKKVYQSPDVLRTSTMTFIIWLIMVIVLVDTISFLPALALGPIVEHLLMITGGVF